MGKKIEQSDFIKRAKEVHGDKYDYCKTDLAHRDERGRVCIICKKHGEFWQKPNDHLEGHSCPMCKGKFKTTESFIKEAKEIHGDKYDYSKVEYKGCKSIIKVICPKHGEFETTPNSHLNGKGCRACSYEKRANDKIKTVNKFIEEAKKVHGNRYDYSKTKYERCDKEVVIICPIHGEFKQTPSNHLASHGCPECGKIEKANKKKKTTEQFIEEAKKVHGNRYDYSKVEYKGIFDPVIIICHKHGDFKQRAADHLNGHGCHSCINSTLEQAIETELLKNKIVFKEYHKFKWLINENTNYPYSLDFYLPEYNIAIECQGIQHFKPIKFFGGEINLRHNIKRDLDKKKLCNEHNIELIYFLEEKYNKYLDKKDLYFNKTKDLINYILNHGKNNT